MDERAARDVVLVRAVEAADAERRIWTDAERTWATREAAERVGESADDEAFVHRRAALALARLAERYPKAGVLFQASTPRPWALPVVVIGAFVIGIVGVDVGSTHRINLLAPPLLGLLAWNLAVYAMLILSAIAQRRESPPQANARRRNLLPRASGPLRGVVVTWLRGVARPFRSSAVPPPLALALGRFATEWPALAMPLWQQRAARLLHVGAAALACGAIGGLYLRGIAFEFRAGWQSTFLDATDVARLLQVVLAPGAWLTGIAIPNVERLRAIAGEGAGENAAPWIHLYAATVMLVVVVPRLALAVTAWMRERRYARRFPLSLEHVYFRRLLQAWHEGRACFAAIPYSLDVSAAARKGVATLLTRVFQTTVEIAWHPKIAYGDDAPPELPASALAGVLVLFGLAATPERESHRAFVGALAARIAGRAPLIVIVDTSDFARRFADQPQRIAERQDLWQQELADQGSDPLFVRLAAPELHDAGAALESRLARAGE